MASGGTSASRRSVKDKEMAAEMKRKGIERWTGVCPMCYSIIPNDTFGGFGAARHLTRCVVPSPKRRQKFSK